jgi:chromosomal replication initiator protein
MNAEQAWQSVIGQLQMEMPRASFDTWVRDTRVAGYDAGVMTVGVRNAYARDWLESRLMSTVARLLAGIMERAVDVRFVITNGNDSIQTEDAAPEAHPSDDIPVAQSPEGASVTSSRRPFGEQRNSTLNPRYTFDNFVVGANNRLAHAASQAVAEKPARAYNPLFLYGGVGLGKTHLLHAIGNSCHQRGLSVLYVSSEEFTNDMVNAIRTRTTQAFREKYRSADVLLIDDIQFIAGKEGTQEEFFHTFNTLHSQDKQIIVSSDRPPKSMVTLEERLRSRFEWGLIADIQSPDLETRQAILRYKAERLGRNIPNEILDTIARRVQSNIRELEGALNRIVAFADLSGSELTPRLVEMALSDLMPQIRSITPTQVVDLVARAYNLTSDQMLGRDRSQNVALPRQIAMYLIREASDASLPQIGQALGGRDHTTVMYAIEKIADKVQTDQQFHRQVDKLREQLYGQSVAA